MAKKCYQCGVTKTFRHLDRNVCERCFIRLIGKRVQRGLGRVFSKGDKILVVGDLSSYFFDWIMKDFPLVVIKKKRMPKDISKFDKVVVEITIDDVDAEFLYKFFNSDLKANKEKKIISILSSITDEEAVLFAKIKSLDFSVSDKNKIIKDFLKEISVKHAEVRFNLLKNVKGVEKIL